MKIKAKEKNGVVKVKALLKHDMETGRRKDKAGNAIPAHFITEVKAEYNGEQVLHIEMGTAISKNPFIAFAFNGKKGDSLSMTWLDTNGETKTAEGKIK